MNIHRFEPNLNHPLVCVRCGREEGNWIYHIPAFANHPLEWCDACKRETQRHNNAPACFWCKVPFGTRVPEIEKSDRRAFEDWRESEWRPAEEVGLREFAYEVWKAAKGGTG